MTYDQRDRRRRNSIASETETLSSASSLSHQHPQRPTSPLLLPREHRPQADKPFRQTSTQMVSNKSSSGQSSGGNSQSPSVGSNFSRANALADSVISNIDLDLRADGRRPSPTAPRRMPLAEEEAATRKAKEAMNPSFSDTSAQGATEDVMADQRRVPPSSLAPLMNLLPSLSTSSGSSIVTPSSLLSPDDQYYPRVEYWSRGQHRDLSDHDAAPHEPKTIATGQGNPYAQTIPTVSATGMSRLFPLSSEDPARQDRRNEAPPLPELFPEGAMPPPCNDSNGRRTGAKSPPYSVLDGDEADEEDHLTPLFVQAFIPSSSLTFTRRLGIVTSSFALNFGLPFINGLFLGFGEIFARSLITPVVLRLLESRWPHFMCWKISGARLQRQAAVSRAAEEHVSILAQADTARHAGTGISGAGVRATIF